MTGNRLTFLDDLVVARGARRIFSYARVRREGRMTALFIGEIEVSEENRQDYKNVFLAQAYKELEEAGARLRQDGLVGRYSAEEPIRRNSV
jgi:hypothetical protein